MLDHVDFIPAPEELSPLVLAYIGDAVYELYVRLLLVAHSPGKMKDLHQKAVSFVKAGAQADILKEIEPMLSGEERDIVRWGRNAKSGHVPKSAQMVEYRYSTGFEALIGYLYLKGRYDRLSQLMRRLEKMIAERETGRE
ncbi:MAG TPA: Mini-ribonuclease 3 [Clostridia bacterium]|nr:Mini-ribonuclease 3 [Clostridia bacterium]